MAATILIAEDDRHLCLLISEKLTTRYSVLCCHDGSEAWEQFRTQSVDLIITDIAMPGMNGYDLARKVREKNGDIPILMLTANQAFSAKRTGFSTGIDDYLTKPFDNDELLWRVQALLRRVEIKQENHIDIGGIRIDKASYELSRGDFSLSLPRKEFDLLYMFLSEPGRIFTKHQLMERVWGYDSDSTEDTIKTHISRLRRKIQDFPELSLVAIKGIGYKVEVK